jgi:hypothetical protein
LISERKINSFRDHHLTLADHVHQFNSGQHIPGSSEGLETHHGFRDSLHRSVILLNDVVGLASPVFAAVLLTIRPLTYSSNRPSFVVTKSESLAISF